VHLSLRLPLSVLLSVNKLLNFLQNNGVHVTKRLTNDGCGAAKCGVAERTVDEEIVV
jgi:hypothetical protein